MKYNKYLLLISIFINIFFILNADFASAKICVNDDDCGSFQKCVDAPQTNIDPDTETTTKICADSCPPQTSSYCPDQPEDKNYTCVNYTCIQLEEPLPPVPGTQITSLDTYIKYVYQIALGVVGLMALIMLIIGGVTYMTAAGNASQMSEAKDRIQSAILGLILALAAYLILYTINPDLVRLKPVQLSYPSMPKVILSCENNICKAKSIDPQDVTSATQNTCGEAGTECPPSCRLINAFWNQQAAQIDEKVTLTVQARGLCGQSDNVLLLPINIWEQDIGNDDLVKNDLNILSEFKKGFPYYTATGEWTVPDPASLPVGPESQADFIFVASIQQKDRHNRKQTNYIESTVLLVNKPDQFAECSMSITWLQDTINLGEQGYWQTTVNNCFNSPQNYAVYPPDGPFAPLPPLATFSVPPKTTHTEKGTYSPSTPGPHKIYIRGGMETNVYSPELHVIQP